MREQAVNETGQIPGLALGREIPTTAGFTGDGGGQTSDCPELCPKPWKNLACFWSSSCMLGFSPPGQQIEVSLCFWEALSQI